MSSLKLTHEQAQRQKQNSDIYDKGYQRGWWHQPPESDDEEYMAGYETGWNHRWMDRN